MAPGKCRRDGRSLRHVESAGGDHHGLAAPDAAIRDDLVAISVARQGFDRGAGLERGIDEPGVAFDERHHLGHCHEAVGIVTVVGEAGHPGLPVGRQQTQGVPALRPPRVGHLAALDHHMIDPARGEAMAHGEAGMPGPDHDGRRMHGEN